MHIANHEAVSVDSATVTATDPVTDSATVAVTVTDSATEEPVVSMRRIAHRNRPGYHRPVVWRVFVLLTVVLLGCGIATAIDEKLPCQQQNLFQAEGSEGVVWANLNLTRQRVAEPYVPIVIGIQNKSGRNVKVTRESLWLNDQDGLVYSMPTVKALRGEYDKILADARLASADGIPWLNWRRARRFEPSNFFPDMRAVRGNTTRDTITLRSGFGLVDLFYFERPRDLKPCAAFFVVVHPEEWETPIRFSVFIP